MLWALIATAWRDAARKALPRPVLARVQAARWALRRFRHRVRWLATGRRGRGIGLSRFDGRLVAYRLHSVDTAVLHHSFDRDIFFAAIPDLALADDAVILDAGAHIGTFALLASEKVPNGRVYAVEASAETCDLLRTNITLNRRHNIVADHLAMAGANGPVTLHHDPEGNYGHSITKQLSGSSEVVEGITLEHFLDAHGIGAVAIAKFNCEGAEFPVLLATPPTVLARIRTMVILYHCDLSGRPVSVLIDHLHTAGFRTTHREDSMDRGWLIARR